MKMMIVVLLFFVVTGNTFKRKITKIEYYVSSPSGGYFASADLIYADLNQKSVKKAFNEVNYAAFCRMGDSSFLNDSLYEIYYSRMKVDSFVLDSFFVENQSESRQQETTKIILYLYSDAEIASVIKVDYNWNFMAGRKKYTLTKSFREFLLKEMPCELRTEWENIKGW